MKKIIINTLIAMQAVFLTSCLTAKQTNLLQQPGGGILAYPQVETPAEEYQVKAGDQLAIMVTTNPMDVLTTQLFSYFSTMNYSGSESGRGFPVRTDGMIYFPYLGDIHVAGKTTLEIQQLIENRINTGVADDCIVKVSLENRYFSVIGEAKAGRFPIAKEQLTLYQALAQCGDIPPYGNRAQVKVIRQMDDGTVIKTFDLRSRDIINSEFYYIQPNDIIYIQPLGRRFFGLDSFGAVFAITSSLISFGIFIYSLVK